MSTSTIASETRALSSDDGRTWHDGTPVDWTGDPTVSKIVIGTPPRSGSDDAEPIELAAPIPANLAEDYPGLTHLHLWQISNLTALPKLPPGLKCLDVRGCGNLTELPMLPSSIETLDLGHCEFLARLPNVPAALRRLFLNDCTSLEDDILSVFMLELSQSNRPKIIECDFSRCPGVTSVRRFPVTLERLVLQGCQNLSDADQLDRFTELHHLNLSECPKLTRLTGIPEKLQYFQLFGSDNLQYFMGQSLGVYDRGTKERPNVAGTLYTRRKFGDELAASAHAKLLFLGDGRVGKSTLAKRLQWDCLTLERQQSPEWQHLKPSKDEKFTHKVRFNRWQTTLQLPDAEADKTNQRALAAGIDPPCAASGSIPGTIRIWDFGGQEIYHQTHRIFAAEGSVFLIVWNPRPLDEAELLAQKPKSGVSDEEWREWNRPRSLDYWLEYVDSLRRDVQVALVCTNTPEGSPHSPWTTRAEKHKKRNLSCFYIDSLDDACVDNPEYQKLLNFIREACGAEATRIGLLQPAFYSRVSAFVDELLAENDADRHAPDRRPKNLLFPYEEWTQNLIYDHSESGASQHALDAQDVESITGYLHEAGRIFQIRETLSPSILIDQGWATDVIYKMLRPADDDEEFCIFNIIRKRNGYLDEGILQLDSHWQSLRSDAERQHILQYMQQCGIIVPIQNRSERRSGEALYLATERWLLPEYNGHIAQHCETIFGLVRDQPEATLLNEFSFGKQRISEFDFRSLMVHLGSVLRTRATFFRDGLQASNGDATPVWCFQVRWLPDSDDSFFGRIVARLAAPKSHMQELAQQVEEVFRDDDSPMARGLESWQRMPAEIDEFSHCFFREITDADIDVGVSYSSRDKDIVAPLLGVLRSHGRSRVWEYTNPECRYDEFVRIQPFMESLRNPPCLLMILSDSYLRSEPQNWYCLWEFADAVRRLADGSVQPERFLVVYRVGGHLTEDNLRDIASAALDVIGKHFEKKYDDLKISDRTTAREYRDRADHFFDAKSKLSRFAQEKASGGAFSRYETDSDGTFDFTELVNTVKRVLKREGNV